MDDDYRRTLNGIRVELEESYSYEAELEQNLITVRKHIEELVDASKSLARIVGEEQEEAFIGITEAIKKILRDGNDRIWTPRNVRYRLRKKEFPLEKYKNPLAVIHTTLKRLEKQGEIRTTRKNGKIFYKWVDPTEEK